MRQSSGDKISDDEKMSSKKSTRKAAVIFILVIAAVFLVIWFGHEYLATETVISETPVHLNGQDRILNFSEKTNKHRMKNADNMMESGITHFAYFIELIDSDSKVSLDIIRFRSPVNEIQNTPELIAFPNGTVWIVSTTDVEARDRRGFILKFVVRADKISEVAFALDDKYQIREIKENKVILSEKGSFDSPYNSFSGGIYLDLETEEVVDDRKETEE